MKKGKSPGEFKAQQKQHRARQYLYDAFKKMKDTGEAECFYQEKRYKLIDPNLLEMNYQDIRTFGFVKFGNSIKLCWIADKDGLRASSYNSDHSRYIQWSDVLALATEMKP